LKKKILSYSLWILICLAVLEAYKVFLNIGIKKNTIGVYKKLNEIFEGKNNYDFLILGSSRAESHVSPKILDSSLRVNSFNLGIPGSFIHQQLAFLNAYLKHHNKPKTLVLSVDIHGYVPLTDYKTIGDFNRYFPYLNHDDFYKDMCTIAPNYFFYKNIAAYRLAFDKKDESLNNAIRGYLQYQESTLPYYKGFAFSPYEEANGRLSQDTVAKFESLPPPIIWKAFENLNKTCHEQGIDLIVVFSPLYKSLRDAIKNEVRLRSAIKQVFKGRFCLDYTFSSISDTRSLFTDPMHLNKQGALQFSQILSADLLQFLDKKNVK
jgi:hypothetical protein